MAAVSPLLRASNNLNMRTDCSIDAPLLWLGAAGATSASVAPSPGTELTVSDDAAAAGSMTVERVLETERLISLAGDFFPAVGDSEPADSASILVRESGPVVLNAGIFPCFDFSR